MTTVTRTDRRLLAHFLDEQMGIPVLLIDSAYEAESSGVSGITVPDIPGLESAMAIARVLNDFKLNGMELRFLRRAIGMKAIDIADFLDVSPETVSRWENGKETISTNSERILRLRVYNTLRDKAHGVVTGKGQLNTILEMKFRVVRSADQGPMAFRYVTDIAEGRLRHVWYFDGMYETSCAHSRIAQLLSTESGSELS